MKQLYPCISLFLFLSFSAKAISFEKFFTDKACRIDFYFCGNAGVTSAYISVR